MATYTAPLRDIAFVLDDVLHVGRLCAEIPRFADVDAHSLTALAEEAAKLAEEQIAPLNATADAEGCRWEGGSVFTPAGFKRAFQLLAEGGWVGLTAESEYGGQGLPYVLGQVVGEMISSACAAFSLYPGLTGGCFDALHAAASETQKQAYLPKLASGEWTGTMCLTEPQAGTDLASVKMKATPLADGRYRLDGAKIFITSGEHDLADNIVHFVLARTADAPAGIRGLSTFVVPKFRLRADGTPGERNGVICTGIEHKMGLHGSATCQLSFDGAIGEMVGEPFTGIRNMFVMMNRARILVGGQGLGQCEFAAQNAIRYARERKQGRPLSGGDTDVAIIEHADVRRMLLRMKALTEGARVMHYETALNVDLAQHHPQQAVREAAQDWVDLATPLVKSFCTDAAFELGSLAIQVYGGHGYIRDNGIEQIARDSKIFSLYEGTNGVQAMDLVRRKLLLGGGRLPERFFQRVRASIGAAAGVPFLTEPLQTALDALERTTAWMIEQFRSAPDDAAFGAVDYLRAFALTYLGYNWLRLVLAVLPQQDTPFGRAKLATARYFATRLLSEVPALCANASAGAAELMALDASAF